VFYLLKEQLVNQTRGGGSHYEAVLLNQYAPVVREIILARDGVLPVHKF
jgi:hypothetical protein